jgi:hypothetical protein
MIQRQMNASCPPLVPGAGLMHLNQMSPNAMNIISIDQDLIPQIHGYIRTAETLQQVSVSTSELVSQSVMKRNKNSSAY